MHFATRVIVPALVVLLLSACQTGPRVYSNMDPRANFERYQTFGFVERPGTDRGDYSSLLTERLKHTTRAELEARGYRFDAQSPDLLVNFNLSTERRVEALPGPASHMAWGGYYPHRWGHYHPWSGWGYEPTLREYREGTLNVDIVDAAERRLVWEGMSVTRLGRDGYGYRNEVVDEAVSHIFRQFPG